MNVTVLIPIWKRHDITKACFDNLKRQQDKFGFDVVVVGSEGEASENLTAEFGFKYLEFSNEFLGAKLNAGLKLCKGSVVVIGSDDFLSDSAFHFYNTIDHNSLSYYGIKNCYIFSTQKQYLSLFNYKGQSFKTIGVGRIYTKAMIKACGGKLWADEKRNGLDTIASEICAKNGGIEVITDLFNAIDVKHSHNLTSPEIYRIGERREVKEIGSVFGFNVRLLICGLKYSPNDTHRIKVKKVDMKTQKVEITLLRDVGNHKKGTTILQPKIRAKRLVKIGTAEYAELKPKAEIKEVKPVKTKTKQDGKVQEQKPSGSKNTDGKKGKKQQG